jgi:hypothetical protein
MSASVSLQNIKYIAPVAVSRLYEQRHSFFQVLNSGSTKTPPPILASIMMSPQMQERRIQSEKNMERIQKKMIASNSTNGFAYTQAATATKSQTKPQKKELQ